MNSRSAPSWVIGLSLVVLIAIASLAASWLVLDRAEGKARVEDDRAAQTAREALQNSLGRVVTTLRGADGLVDERGVVDEASFLSFARAVGSLPGTGSLALEEVVAANQRSSFEARHLAPILEFVRTGEFRTAAERPSYLPIVAVWPQTPANQRLLGLDLLSEPARRRTIALARSTRRATFTELIPLAAGDRGLLAFKPLFVPGRLRSAPVGFVSASFSTSVIDEVFEQLPRDLRIRVAVDGATIFETAHAPTDGKPRTLMLGGRRWAVTARAKDASTAEPIAILLCGWTLAALLAAFTRSRISFERRLVRANNAERQARQRSELLERNAAHLAGAVTLDDVAGSTVADLTEAGIEIAAVHMLRGELVDVLATAGLSDDRSRRTRSYGLTEDNAAAEAIRSGEVVEVATAAEYDERYPGSARGRRREHLESLVAVPLRNADGGVIGALVAASRTREWLDQGLRLVVVGVAEQCGVALERARLQAIEREARRRASILQHLVGRLSAAVVPTEVADACIPSLVEAFEPDACVVGIVADSGIDVLWMQRQGGIEERDWASLSLSSSSIVAQAVSGAVVEAHGTRQIEDLYGEEAAAELSGRDVTSLLLTPLPDATGCVGVAFRRGNVLGAGDRELLEAIGDDLSQALKRATLFDSERNARRRAELMEQNAAHLAAASDRVEVAAFAVADFEDFGADVVFVWRMQGNTLEAIAATDVAAETRRRFQSYPLDRAGLVTEALQTGTVATVDTAIEYDARYPDLADERRRLGVESMVAVPLRAASGDVVGALFAASKQQRWLNADRRQVLLGIAEQTGVALERASLFETEREARRLAELLEKNAAHLAAAVTTHDVAASTVADLERAGVGLAEVYVLRRIGIELLDAAGVSPDTLERHRLHELSSETVAAEVVRHGQSVEVHTAGELEGAYPGSVGLWRDVGAESLIAVPLRATDRRVLGVLVVNAHEPGRFPTSTRQVILGVAEQCGLAVERAQLQAELEETAATAAFLARLSELLERSTTVRARVHRLVELLTEQLATFAAVHLLDPDGSPQLVAQSGSRPAETGDDEQWTGHVEQVVAGGRALSTRSPLSEPGSGATTESFTILPLRARGHIIGALTLRAAPDAFWEPAISPALAREIASRAAVVIDNALLYERERDVSHSLQLGLLGGALPVFDRLVVTAAYRAGTETLEVGGDWFDAFHLPSGAVGLVVGDVVGHGLEAAVAMGQLRGASSALAQTGSPARILERLDTFVESVPAAATATIAYVELDPASGRIQYACAGHPPPLVVSPDGRARYLWEGRSAPLGSTLGDRREEASDILEGGDTLVLYTDGLVERRTNSFDDGLARLARAAKLHAPRASNLADDLCEALLDGQSQDDDVCVLAVHRLPVTSVYRRAFHADPAELAGLRESLRAWLEERGIAAEAERSTVLAVSEAAANAIEHGYGCDGVGIVTVLARLDGKGGDQLEISVRDEGGWREGESADDRGRGLAIIQAIVDELSIAKDDGGTVLHMSRLAGERTSA